MRLIDADAFDERVRVAGGMSEEELTEDFKDGVQAVLYMLSNQPTIQPEPHWIPVTERLPVEYDNPIELLCTLEDNDGNRYVDLILWTGCDWENNYTDDNEQNKYGIDKVVGWMFSPIPMRKGDVTK